MITMERWLRRLIQIRFWMRGGECHVRELTWVISTPCFARCGIVWAFAVWRSDSTAELIIAVTLLCQSILLVYIEICILLSGTIAVNAFFLHRCFPAHLIFRPCHHIPGGKARPSIIERTDEHHPRIEHAFRKYFFRASLPPLPDVEQGKSKSDAVNIGFKNVDEVVIPIDNSSSQLATVTKSDANQTQQLLKPHPQHEFEIIVCHGNVIRYFFCRALQLPPEAWLRLCVFNCSLTYFTIRPTGTVSCRMLGDVGHLPYDLCTFSMHTGFNWWIVPDIIKIKSAISVGPYSWDQKEQITMIWSIVVN